MTKLVIEPKTARLYRDLDTFGKMDPYVTITGGDKKRKSKTHNGGGKNPTWNDTLTVKATSDTITITVWDADIGKDDFVGSAVLDVTKMAYAGGLKDWVTLYHKGKEAGEIYLEISFLDKKAGGGYGGYGGSQSYYQAPQPSYYAPQAPAPAPGYPSAPGGYYQQPAPAAPGYGAPAAPGYGAPPGGYYQSSPGVYAPPQAPPPQAYPAYPQAPSHPPAPGYPGSAPQGYPSAPGGHYPPPGSGHGGYYQGGY